MQNVLIAGYTSTSLRFEACLLIVSLIAGWWMNPLRLTFLSRARTSFFGLANRPWYFGALLFFLSLSINGFLSWWHPPEPWVHDEFSYLLASDTFSHGRLSNPSHPMWKHFETFHVIQQPTYMSKYPPATGIMLAFGQKFAGSPIVGAWLGLSLAVTAVYWMFRAWLPTRWAAVGGVLIAVNAPIAFSWGQSYWGGAMAMLGGALMFGGLRRIWRDARSLDGMALATGLVVLANSRPLEGFLACLPVFGSLVVWLLWDRRRPTGFKLIHVVLPTTMIGVIGVLWMLTYNHAVTGRWTTLPYQLHDSVYSASSLLIWKEPPAIPSYNHPRMKTLYVSWARERQLALRGSTEYRENVVRKLSLLWDFFTLGGGICLFGLPWALRDRWIVCAVVTLCLIVVLHLQLATSQLFPHYLAPLAPLFWVASLQGLRYVGCWKRTFCLGKVVIRAALIFALLKWTPWISVWSQPKLPQPRSLVAAKLEKLPGKHLVLVKYSPEYSYHAEWVYNDSDIDASRIVWARSISPEADLELRAYYSERNAWHWKLETVDDQAFWRWNSSPTPTATDFLGHRF